MLAGVFGTLDKTSWCLSMKVPWKSKRSPNLRDYEHEFENGAIVVNPRWLFVVGGESFELWH